MPKISVLIPVYNAEPFLDECMHSVLEQTFDDIEIICIDDGSKDNSGRMLDDFALKDERVKVIHKENTGYGHSMNLAISEASSEYIAIVEPDDYISKDALKILYSYVKENKQKGPIDFVKGNYYQFSTNKKPCVVEPFSKKYLSNRVIKPRKYIITFRGTGSIWTGLYRREWLIKNNVKFLETPGASYQDTGFYIKCIFEADRAIFIRDAVYYYRIDNQNSSVKDNSKVFAIVDEFNSLEDRYKGESKAVKIINSLKLDKYSWNYNRLSREGQLAFMEEYQKLIPILKNHEYYYEILGKEMLKDLYKSFGLTYPLSIDAESFLYRITRKIREKWLS